MDEESGSKCDKFWSLISARMVLVLDAVVTDRMIPRIANRNMKYLYFIGSHLEEMMVVSG